ncbi:MAG TPA: hydrogenase nickel incorporation protein HypB [Armatimonadota bacterium]|jgi:hydrogenase nickel incorporation protein HypB
MPEPPTRLIEVTEALLGKNEDIAARNRALFGKRGMLVLNVLSSPGSGKTTLIHRAIAELSPELALGVIVGDLATDNDAKRLREAGGPVIQITTGTVCHLEAEMVARAANDMGLDGLDILVIENVGNLVCPSAYDLGEDIRIVLLATTEGEDKPLKYPTMFRTADAVILNKSDISEVLGFDREAALAAIRAVSPAAPIFEVSARTGAGMDAFYRYLRDRLAAKRSASAG